MPPDKTTENIAQLHEKVKLLLKQGKSENDIIKDLEKEGINQDYAHIIIGNVLKDLDDRKSFWKLLFGGLFFVIGGLAINYFSYKIAVHTGSSIFYLFWGIVVVGLLMIIRAFILFRK